jgi:hypothetical protein
MANPLGAGMSFALLGPDPHPPLEKRAARLRFAPFAPRLRASAGTRGRTALPDPPPLETGREALLDAVLERLARSAEGVSFVELVRELAVPRPTLHGVLKAALRRGHVRRVGSHAALRYLRNHASASAATGAVEADCARHP